MKDDLIGWLVQTQYRASSSGKTDRASISLSNLEWIAESTDMWDQRVPQSKWTCDVE